MLLLEEFFCNIKQEGDSFSFDSDTFTFDSTVETFDNNETIVSTGTVYNGAISTAPYIGEYSWGKIILGNRTKHYNYTASILSGYDGIFIIYNNKEICPLCRIVIIHHKYQ